jgi:hypothetical protein
MMSARISISIVMLAAIVLAALTSASAAADDYDDAAEDSLFVITPADYRITFMFGTPILFGVELKEHTTLSYLPGSGLNNIITITLHEGRNIIFHADPPSVDANTSFDLTLEARYNYGGEDYTEQHTLTIRIGDYGLGPVISDPSDDEDDKSSADVNKLWMWTGFVLLFAGLASILITRQFVTSVTAIIGFTAMFIGASVALLAAII